MVLWLLLLATVMRNSVISHYCQGDSKELIIRGGDKYLYKYCQGGWWLVLVQLTVGGGGVVEDSIHFRARRVVGSY